LIEEKNLIKLRRRGLREKGTLKYQFTENPEEVNVNLARDRGRRGGLIGMKSIRAQARAGSDR
jgi:hypothetical protein